jgi:hypothetical protein
VLKNGVYMIRTLCLGLTIATMATVATAETSFISGLTVRVIGELDRMSNLSDLNDSITEMNYYYGPDGDWVQHINGSEAASNWGSILHTEHVNVRPRMGISLEYDVMRFEHSSVNVGLEYTAGSTTERHVFPYSIPPVYQDGSLDYSEKVELSNIMATASYKLRDLNLPVSAHVGAGLGMSKLTQEGIFILAGETMVGTENVMTDQLVLSSFGEESMLTGRIFAGMEYSLGPVGFRVDLGYDFMDFGPVESDTEISIWNFNPEDGEYNSMEIIGASGDRYEFQPVLHSANIRFREFNSTFDASIFSEPLEFQEDNIAETIEYNLSGGFARFTIGYHF